MSFEDTFPTFSAWRRAILSRRGLTWTFAVVAVLLAARLVLDVGAARRFRTTVEGIESEWGPLDPKTLEPPHVPDEENRARVLRAAADLLVRKPLPGRVHGYWPDTLWEPIEEEALEAMVAPNDLALTLALRARDLPRSNWDISYRKGMNADLPNLVHLMNLSRLLSARAVLASQQAEASEAVAAIESGLALSDSLYREPVLIVEMIAVAMDWRNAAMVRHLLARADPRADDLARLQALFERAAEHRPIHEGYLGEMKATHNELLRFTPSGGRLDPNASAWFGSRIVAWWLRPLLRQDHRFNLESMAAAIRWSEKPAWERRIESPPEAMTHQAPWYFFASRELLWNNGEIVKRADLHAARLVLARTALALRRYRLDRGEYPLTLDPLVPAYLGSVPRDPFTGEPPDYRRDGSGFALRSAGEDMDDPGPNPKRDKVLDWRISR